MRVLIVDDDHMSCRCLQQLIDWGKIGCTEVLCSYSGSEALKMIEMEQPDIVVTDVRMPVMDGKELCRLIYEKYPQISIFFVSAYEDFATAQIAIKYNVKGYVLKPLDRETLGELQDMMCEVILRRENTLFCRKLCADEYREVLINAIEERDIETVNILLDRMKELKVGSAVEDISIWNHLIAPIIDYKNTNLKLDFGVLFETEHRMKKEIMACLPDERVDWLRGQYQAIMQEDEYSSDTVWEIQKVIREQFSSPDLDVNLLARMFHMSPVYLGRLFIERTGMKIIDYIQENRIRFACDELRNGTRSVKDISVLAGYRDAGYFNKVFRRKMDMTPMEYREKYRGRGSGKNKEEL